MVHGKNRIPYWIDRRLTGLAGPEYHAIISFGLPFEPEDSQYGKSWNNYVDRVKEEKLMKNLTIVAKGGQGGGGKGGGGKGGSGKGGGGNPNYPSTTGKPSGPGRGNDAPKK